MSAQQPRAYQFSRRKHWERSIRLGFDVTEKELQSIRRVGRIAHESGFARDVEVLTLDPQGLPTWRTTELGRALLYRRLDALETSGPFEVDGVLATSPRLVADREWLWGFSEAPASVVRHERESLHRDLTITLRADDKAVDLATDGHGGVWVLIAGDADALWLRHIDCRGRVGSRCRLPCEAGTVTQIGTVLRGKHLALLADNGEVLVLFDPVSCAVIRKLALSALAPCWSADRLAADGRNRIALWGHARPAHGSTHWSLALLDGDGGLVDGPLTGVLGEPPQVRDIAVGRGAVWFARYDGLRKLDSSPASKPRAAESVLLTPALHSPDGSTVRGWLRAEVDIDLPAGASLEAEYATTDDANVAAQAIGIAEDPSLPPSSQLNSIWALVGNPASPFEGLPDRPRNRRFVFTGPLSAGLLVPLFDSKDRWLWLRLTLHTPADVAPPAIRELRVRYPDLSIAQHLPAAFRGERGDPTGFMRMLVGVLETTTQDIDSRIQHVARHLAAGTAPEGWLDDLARWLDLPWDDGLPAAAKRRVLDKAGAILDTRGTRLGLTTLLAAIVQPASVAVRDLTVDQAPMRLSGSGCAGNSLPATLAGSSLRTPTLGARAVLGRACLGVDCHPLSHIGPTVVLEVETDKATRDVLLPLLARIVAQYVPAGVKVKVRWRLISSLAARAEPDVILVLDGIGTGRLGRDTEIGRVSLAGRQARTLDENGIELGFRLM